MITKSYKMAIILTLTTCTFLHILRYYYVLVEMNLNM